MIFALIGVVILIVSFGIALFSLVREQNKHAKERFDQKPVADGEEKAAYEPPQVDKQLQQGFDARQGIQEKMVSPVEPQAPPASVGSAEEPVDKETVPFPWEEKRTSEYEVVAEQPAVQTQQQQGPTPTVSDKVLHPKTHVRSFSIKDNPSGGTSLKDLTK